MITSKFLTGKNSSSFIESIFLFKSGKTINENVLFVQMAQTHQEKIEKIVNNQNNLHKSIITIPEVDACYTDTENIFLSVKSADCLPILISGITKTPDKKNQKPFIAAVHAGRKGTTLKILKKVLNQLNKEYSPDLLSIWFGPAICVDCYQIDKENDTHFDLISENKQQIKDFIKENSLNENQIQLTVENNCTFHESEKFHSYRKSGAGVKMNYSFIGIIN